MPGRFRGDCGSLSLKCVCFCGVILKLQEGDCDMCWAGGMGSSQLERQGRQEKLLCGLSLGVQLLQEKSIKLK